MLLKNKISILRQTPSSTNYCLSFDGNGFIEIPGLNTFLDIRYDFSFEMEFNVKRFPEKGFSLLMHSCITAENKIGIAVDGNHLYVQFVISDKDTIELFTPFSATESWHTISLENNNGHFSASLDGVRLNDNTIPALSLPSSLGFIIASDTEHQNGLSGLVDNILLTDLIHPIAQYHLNTGSGSIVYDSINKYNGNIANGTWSTHECI